MKFLVDYVKSCFCNHDWKHESTTRTFESEYSTSPWKIEDIYFCEKCLSVKRVKK